MEVSSSNSFSKPLYSSSQPSPTVLGPAAASPPSKFAEQLLSTTAPQEPNELQDAFKDFVGQTFFGEMIKAFRTSQQPSKYFHGGRAEEIFQGQFDQVLTEKLSDASADKISDPMYELFMLKRSQ